MADERAEERSAGDGGRPLEDQPERELGPLAARDDSTIRLASTLGVFLEEGASFVRAARRLGVHTNTVTYRVRRAEDLLGHKVTERQLELRVALRLARLVESP